MEITDIKSNLPITVILSHYSLTVNKNNHLKCPFHKDDKPSLRIYPATNTYNCFGCGKTGDVIQFIQDYEKCTKHEAIQKAKTLVGNQIINTVEQKPSMQTNYADLYPKFKQSLHRSKCPNPL